MKITKAFPLVWVLVWDCAHPAVTGEPTVSAAIDEDGVLVHRVTCSFQAGETSVRVLLPDAVDSGRRCPVVFVLPVEARNEHRYGDGLAEAKLRGLHNAYSAIFVAPTFSHLPWYADHPTDPAIRQETYFIEIVLPLIDRDYSFAAGPGGRYLLGFSKSGWGAWSLLLRHPDLFAGAAAWDAPLQLDHPGPFGSQEVFGTAENFEKYCLSRQIGANATVLRDGKRLVVTGYGGFRRDHQRTHERLNQLGIAHEYRDGPQRKHDWHSGWVREAVELLLRDRNH